MAGQGALTGSCSGVGVGGSGERRTVIGNRSQMPLAVSTAGGRGWQAAVEVASPVGAQTISGGGHTPTCTPYASPIMRHIVRHV